MKTFHGHGFTYLKYKARLVKHVCHPVNGKHECCLDEIYNLYLGLVQACSNEVTAFYFKPNSKLLLLTNNLWELTRFSNNILPSP